MFKEISHGLNWRGMSQQNIIDHIYISIITQKYKVNHVNKLYWNNSLWVDFKTWMEY